MISKESLTLKQHLRVKIVSAKKPQLSESADRRGTTEVLGQFKES